MEMKDVMEVLWIKPLPMLKITELPLKINMPTQEKTDLATIMKLPIKLSKSLASLMFLKTALIN